MDKDYARLAKKAQRAYAETGDLAFKWHAVNYAHEAYAIHPVTTILLAEVEDKSRVPDVRNKVFFDLSSLQKVAFCAIIEFDGYLAKCSYRSANDENEKQAERRKRYEMYVENINNGEWPLH